MWTKVVQYNSRESVNEKKNKKKQKMKMMAADSTEMSEYRNSSICIPFQCAPVIRQIQFQKCSISKRFTVNQSTKKQILYLHRNPIAMGHRPIIYRKSILRRFGTISFPETTSCHKHNHRHHRYHHK